MKYNRSAFWLRRVPCATALLAVTLVSVTLVSVTLVSVTSGDIIRTIQHDGVSIDMWFVNVGDEGNAPDTYGAGYGAVPYDYEIGEFAVSAGQYETVRAAAGLDSRGSTYLSTGDQPVNFVSWFEAARFTNWLTSGNPDLGAYDTSATGWGSATAYTGSGVARDSAAMANLTNTYGKVYFLPSEDEWYKAAHYEGGSTNAGYWMYPTGSNAVPTAVAGGVSPGTAVYNQSDWSGGGHPADVDNAGGRSAYGTVGQGGNVWEWTETLNGTKRRIRGGSFSNTASYMAASYDYPGDPPTNEHRREGFRVASTAAVRPNLIANGNFESVTTNGQFHSWSYGPNGSEDVAEVSTSPSVIQGTYSAELLSGATNGGVLYQKVSDTGLSDFTWELDFAVLPDASTRSFHIATYSSSGVSSPAYLDALRVNASNQIEFYDYIAPGTGYTPTGLFAATTGDTGVLGLFDGETPVLNHLKFVGTGYGTDTQYVSITLSRAGYEQTYTGIYDGKKKLTIFGLYGGICQKNVLVDNVSLHAIPEPSSLVLLTVGLCGLLACTRRRRE